MNWQGPEFVIAIIGVSTCGWLVNNWIRARHGYDLEDEWGGKTTATISAETQRLIDENARLQGRLDQFAERLGVLERIVTDKGYDVSAQIEALRDVRSAGTRDVREDERAPSVFAQDAAVIAGNGV